MKTIQVPDSMPLADIFEFLRKHDLKMQWTAKGTYRAIPAKPEKRK